MPNKTFSALHIHEESKSALNKAESTWKKTSNAFFRLRRERLQTNGEITEAEREAEQAYKMALSVLTAAREHWRFIQSTVPTSKFRHGCKESVHEEGLDEGELA